VSIVRVALIDRMISAQDEGAAHYYVKYALENIRVSCLSEKVAILFPLVIHHVR
jgi:hypothetical protein